MSIVDQIGGLLGSFGDAIHTPIVNSTAISEGISNGISDAIRKNRKWIELEAVKLILLLLGLFFFCFGVIQIGNEIFWPNRGLTAIAVGLIALAGMVLISKYTKEHQIGGVKNGKQRNEN